MDLKSKLAQVKEEISKKGYSFSLYDFNLNQLLSSITEESFIEKYNKQLDEGINSIELDENDLTPFTLDQLKEMALNTVIEYAEAELEFLEENDDN